MITPACIVGRVVLKKRVMPHSTSQENEFFAAICHNESELVLRLLAMGCEVNAFFENGLMPLMVAARAGADDVLEVLLQEGADARVVDAEGRNALNWLCRSGQGCHSYLERHTEPARKLLAAGADPYCCDTAGDSAFWHACRYGLSNVLRLIHAHSPLPLETRHRSGDTPLLMASRHMYRSRRHMTSNVVTLLVGIGCDCEARGADGKAPQELCRYADWIEWSPAATPHQRQRMLAVPPFRSGRRYRTGIRFGPRPGVDTSTPLAADKRGNTALHHAARLGETDAAARLIDAGAVVDVPNRSGATPLMLAARCGHWHVGALLLAHGADMHRKDCQGRTSIQQAAMAGNRRLLSMMGAVGIIVDKRRENR